MLDTSRPPAWLPPRQCNVGSLLLLLVSTTICRWVTCWRPCRGAATPPPGTGCGCPSRRSGGGPAGSPSCSSYTPMTRWPASYLHIYIHIYISTSRWCASPWPAWGRTPATRPSPPGSTSTTGWPRSSERNILTDDVLMVSNHDILEC